ncbi:MAG: hypothetical protein CMJ19_16945 [Phycisphaeraceae bacterium]|nr:hypothetical protein [Phycisphaeraceae bacterium]
MALLKSCADLNSARPFLTPSPQSRKEKLAMNHLAALRLERSGREDGLSQGVLKNLLKSIQRTFKCMDI